jgi:hypothetical protein
LLLLPWLPGTRRCIWMLLLEAALVHLLLFMFLLLLQLLPVLC